ncbi:TadE/TadG family type IV pilus assembly protein [Actibacterium ureilyticum]|uniref:TadE/TadG family type IV pilus assembly protein n=1 Tax=Actibacterium ureilyticum TaxID=1590614 RepID=UPI0015963996|nr:TadE family protein [Actibacterium ureilyticum]
MIPVLTPAARRLRRLHRDEGGIAALEFAILLPIFITLFVSAFELAMWMNRQVMLDRAVDLTVRDLRLGTWPNLSGENGVGILKESICSRVGDFVPDCENQILLELYPMPKPDWPLPDPAARCVDRGSAEKPIVNFNDGPENEMMLVRACVMIDPFFPGTGLALYLQDNIGDGFAMVSTSAYVNEPRPGS